MSTVPESRTARIWTSGVQALLGAAAELGHEVMKKPLSAGEPDASLARLLRPS
jgi:hypothetical protein